MRVLVCGGRNFGKLNRLPDGNPNREDDRAKEYRYIMDCLNEFASEYSESFKENDNWLPDDIEIISGAATGADSAAIDWAVVNWCRWQSFPADWDRYGKSAGYIRNQQMLDEGKPDYVIAFPGGKGTEMMKKIARKAGIPVFEYVYGDTDE